jgi:hypothetical protein
MVLVPLVVVFVPNRFGRQVGFRFLTFSKLCSTKPLPQSSRGGALVCRPVFRRRAGSTAGPSGHGHNFRGPWFAARYQRWWPERARGSAYPARAHQRSREIRQARRYSAGSRADALGLRTRCSARVVLWLAPEPSARGEGRKRVTDGRVASAKDLFQRLADGAAVISAVSWRVRGSCVPSPCKDMVAFRLRTSMTVTRRVRNSQYPRRYPLIPLVHPQR